MTNEILDYNHDVYAAYKPDGPSTWEPVPPAITKQDEVLKLLNHMIDTSALEEEYGNLKFWIEFGVLDWMLEQPTTTPGTKSKLETMRAEYHRIGESLKTSHEQNHNIAMAVGGGMINQHGAQSSYYGTTFQHSSGNAFHHNSVYGNQHAPPQHQGRPPSLLDGGKSLFTMFTGVPLPHGGQQQQPQPYYPPQQQRYY